MTLIATCGKGGSSSPTISTTTTTLPPLKTITKIDVTPGTTTILLHGFQQFGATARDAQGSPISGVTFNWFSDDTNVATIDPNCLVLGKTQGQANITASVGSIIGGAQLRINLTAVSAIDIFPSTTVVEIGQSQQFAATAKDALAVWLKGSVDSLF